MLPFELVGRWSLGALAGTLLVATTSPWFVRSYVAREFDAARNASVLSADASYFWRSEGYAKTAIGPHGIPGWSSPHNLDQPADRGVVRVALWGDSQAEGMCLNDAEKISAQVERLSGGQVQVLTLARSGDDCNDWIAQIQSVEKNLHIDAHVFLLVEWSDWTIQPATPDELVSERNNSLARRLPAFLIHAIRNVSTQGSDNQPRQLRFGPGPIAEAKGGEIERTGSESRDQTSQRLSEQLKRLRETTLKPLLLLYAPKLPAVVDGKVLREDEFEWALQPLKQELPKNRSVVIDLRRALNESAMKDHWPRGFQNGQFGVGHYNAVGNAILADALVRGLSEMETSARSSESL